MNRLNPKPLHWVASSKNDLLTFPPAVQRVIGFARRAAQNGGKHPDAKPLKGFGGAGVLEIVENFDGDTYRAVYTVKLAGAVYVLHAFQKKSKHGTSTPRHDLEMIRSRLETARRTHETRGDPL